MDERKTIAVFFGGCSAEYRVSLQSAGAVIRSADRNRYHLILIGINRSSGTWLWYRGDAGSIEDDRWEQEAECVPVFASFDRRVHGLCYLEQGEMRTISLDAALPVLHGKNGEDGTLQGTLELMGVPVIGCGLLSSAVCMDKELAHRIAAMSGINVPKSVVIRKDDFTAVTGDDSAAAAGGALKISEGFAVTEDGSAAAAGGRLRISESFAAAGDDSTAAAGGRRKIAGGFAPAGGAPKISGSELLPAEIKRTAAELGYPLFVKPVRSGSSLGITKVSGEAELPCALAAAFMYDSRVILEEMIDGSEVGCAVLGTERPVTGEVDEIELSEGFFDYTEKYTLKTSKIHVPARITPEKAEEVRRTALTIYRTLGCRHFARVDMFLTPGGEIFFNEVNTIPGFTSHSRYPNMLKAAGFTFEEIVNSLLAMGEEAGRL